MHVILTSYGVKHVIKLSQISPLYEIYRYRNLILYNYLQHYVKNVY